MKNLLLLLLLATVSIQQTVAQTTATCNAAFSKIISGNTVKFLPVPNADSANIKHYWFFGDGSAEDTSYSPTHTYTTLGNYRVIHTLQRFNAGVLQCADIDSTFVQISAIGDSCNLVVNFSSIAATSNPLEIQFTSLSTPPSNTDSARWTFGDGSSAGGSNVIHTYTQAGTYRVCLTVKRRNAPNDSANCVREFCRNIVVQGICNIQPGYNAQRDSAVPNRIRIINNSVNRLPTDSCFWNFGNGTPRVFNNDSSFTYTYTAAGNYNVCLTIKRATNSTVPCIRELCKPVTVGSPNNCNVLAQFNVQRDSTLPNRIRIFNNSANRLPSDSCFWNFGNGTPRVFNNDSSFTYTYNAAGNYNICLTIKRAIAGSTPCVREYCVQVSLLPANCNLFAQFTWRKDAANPLLVQFNYNSITTGATDTVRWYFGDGNSASGYAVTHQYLARGTYNACMMVSRANGCRKDSCQLIVLSDSTIDSCRLQANFTVANGNVANRKLFTNTSTGVNSTTSANWSFGDGTSANTWNAEHTYLAPGVYVACLTVRKSNTCTRVKCDTIRIAAPPPNCDTIRLGMQYRRDSYMPNKLYFFANSNVPVANYRWTITKANGSGAPVVFNMANPIYLFPDTGWYRVCVRMQASNGCVKEKCDSIRIWSTTPPTQCVLQAFPNPASNQVAVNAELTTAGLIAGTIFNNQGMPLQQISQNGIVGNNLLVFNIQTLPQGFYSIKLIYGGKVCFARFQKI